MPIIAATYHKKFESQNRMASTRQLDNVAGLVHVPELLVAALVHIALHVVLLGQDNHPPVIEDDHPATNNNRRYDEMNYSDYSLGLIN